MGGTGRRGTGVGLVSYQPSLDSRILEYYPARVRRKYELRKTTMKHKLAVLLAALLCLGALVPTPAQAVGISISIGDQPYYTRGPWYSHGGTRWYWVSGHW